MRRKRSANPYLPTSSAEHGQPINPPPSMSPLVRNVALACTAFAMLGVGGVLGGVAWYAHRPATDVPLALAGAAASAPIPRAEPEPPTTATAPSVEPQAARPEMVAAAPEVAPVVEPAKMDVAQPATPADAETAAKAEALIGEDDPRWARDVSPAASAFSAGLGDAANARAYADRTESPAWQVLRDAVAEETDGDSAIGTERPESDGTEAADDEQPVTTAAIDPKPKPARTEVTSAAPTGTGRITKGANMRSAPRSGSRVIGTVPSGARVQVVSCDLWCEVVHKGRRGFVFNDFVARGAAAPAKAKARAKAKINTAAAPAAAGKPALPEADKQPATPAAVPTVSTVLGAEANRGR